MLRVASYNIRHGADVRMNMQILADDMTGLNLDVVSLQEVDQGVARSGGIDTMKSLSAASAWRIMPLPGEFRWERGSMVRGFSPVGRFFPLR